MCCPNTGQMKSPALPAAAAVIMKVNPFKKSQGILVLFILSQMCMTGQEYLEKALHLHFLAFASEIYGGQKDVRYEATTLHMSAGTAVSTSTTLRLELGPCPRREQAVVKTEMKFSYFIGEHLC